MSPRHRWSGVCRCGGRAAAAAAGGNASDQDGGDPDQAATLHEQQLPQLCRHPQLGPPQHGCQQPWRAARVDADGHRVQPAAPAGRAGSSGCRRAGTLQPATRDRRVPGAGKPVSSGSRRARLSSRGSGSWRQPRHEPQHLRRSQRRGAAIAQVQPRQRAEPQHAGHQAGGACCRSISRS